MKVESVPSPLYGWQAHVCHPLFPRESQWGSSSKTRDEAGSNPSVRARGCKSRCLLLSVSPPRQATATRLRSPLMMPNADGTTLTCN